MEWYFGNDGDDLVVPKDREPLDRLPSPNSWSDWGISVFPRKDFEGKSFCEEIDINISNHEMECSSNSSLNYGINSSLHQWATLARRQPDYQISEAARMDQMDDIYLNSLLDEDVATDNFYGSSSFSPSSQYSMMSADNLTTEQFLESGQTTYGVGGSKCRKTHSFSPTTDWNQKFVTSPPIKAPVFKHPVSPQHDNEREHVFGDNSPEESALQELERATAKLTARTRNCFRDSLYRLAENSKKQTMNQRQNGNNVEENNPAKDAHDDALRAREMETRESKTNAIDRAVASLMFTKIDFRAEDSTEVRPSDLQQEVNETTETLNYSEDKQCFYSYTMFPGDAEVPIISRQKLLPRTKNQRREFTCAAASQILSQN